MSRFYSIVIGTSVMSLLLTSTALAEDFIIDTEVTTTNGGNDVDGDDSITVTEDGSVTTSGGAAYGLYAFGDGNTLTNSGSVASSGPSFHGLYAVGAGNTLTNSGSVTTSGVGASGIRAFGAGNTLTNSGSVTTSEGDANGLSAFGDGNTLTNSGSVATSGEYADGFRTVGGGITLTNSGSVTTSGEFANGLSTEGADNTLTNSGTVISEQTYAIYIDGNDATLNLLAGSVLQGEVYFDDPDTATLNFGPGLNAVVTIDDGIDDGMIDDEMTITAPNNQYLVDGNTVYVVDGAGLADTTQAIGGVASQVLNTLERQLSYGSMAPAVTQGASTADREGWVQVFGSERRADGAMGDGQTVGVMAGADLDDTRGLFVGMARSTQTLGAGSELESDNLFAGYYASYAINTIDVDASVMAGVASNSAGRSVANNMVAGGLETATAEYKSYYLMPAATFSGDIAVASGDLTPSLRLNYAAVRDQAYEETGSAANLDVDARTSHLFGARLQIDRGLPGYAVGGGLVMANLRAGIDAQYAKGGDISASLLGTDFDLAASDGDTTSRGFAGLDLRYTADATGLELFGSLEVGQSSDDITDVSANIGAVFRF